MLPKMHCFTLLALITSLQFVLNIFTCFVKMLKTLWFY